MSFDNSKKEFYYCLYLLKHKEVLENVVNTKLNKEAFILDKAIYNRKVDIYTRTEYNMEVFVEVQLTESDYKHLEQLEKIINNKELDNYILVWIASSFKDSMLDAIQELINKTTKSICFYAVVFNEKIIGYLERLNNLNPLAIYENLEILDLVDKQLNTVAIYFRKKSSYKKDTTYYSKNKINNPNSKQDIVSEMLGEVRQQIYYYPNVYTDKNLNNNVIILGTGRSDADFTLGINKKNIIFIELRFTPNTKDIFNMFFEMKNEIDDIFDYRVEYKHDYLRLGTYIPYREKSREQIIKQAVRMLDKYIKYFVKYIINYNTNK